MQGVDVDPTEQHCVFSTIDNRPCKDFSPRWLYKKANLIWKLFMLVFLGLCGIYMCIAGVEQRINYQKSKFGFSVTSKVRKEISCSRNNIDPPNGLPVHYPQPVTHDRGECSCTPVHYFVILSMQRSGSGWFETLLNSHPNISSHGEIFSVETRRDNISTIKNTLDTVYNLDWASSAAKKDCTAAVGLKWMLNQGALEYNREVASYLTDKSVSVIFLFRRNILKRYVSILANTFDRDTKQLNGTHQSHVHTREEAAVLAAFKPVVNVTFLTAYLRRIEEIMSDAQFYFNGTRHMTLYYEDLTQKPKILKTVQEFLGVKPRKLKSQHVKIHTLPLSDQILNWKDLSGRLKGTKYEALLNDREYR